MFQFYISVFRGGFIDNVGVKTRGKDGSKPHDYRGMNFRAALASTTSAKALGQARAWPGLGTRKPMLLQWLGKGGQQRRSAKDTEPEATEAATRTALVLRVRRK